MSNMITDSHSWKTKNKKNLTFLNKNHRPKFDKDDHTILIYKYLCMIWLDSGIIRAYAIKTIA